MNVTTTAPAVLRQAMQSMRPIHNSAYLSTLRAVPPRRSTPSVRRAQPLVQSQCKIPVPRVPSRSFTTTPRPSKDHHFDTLKFTQRLQDEGLTPEQAASLMKVLSSVLEESIQNLTRTMVPREDALKTAYTQKIDFNTLRTEVLQSDTSESTLTKTTHDRLQNEVQKLGQRLRDEVERTKSGVKLDLNLEKGRTKDEREAMEMRIRETETRIEQEVAGLRERVEGVKFDTVRWLAGVVTGTMALLLGAWRLFM